MTKEKHIEHLESVTGLKRALLGNGTTLCEAIQWKDAVTAHKRNNPCCPDCKARAKTYKAGKARKSRDDVYRSLGLNKVIGAVSGSVYWE